MLYESQFPFTSSIFGSLFLLLAFQLADKIGRVYDFFKTIAYIFRTYNYPSW